MPNVFILDYLEKDEMTYLMHKVECIILPYKKNTNSAILSDAISVETPVVGSKVGAIKEYITNYRIGELFESENIKELSQKILFVMNGSKKHEYTSNIRQLKKRFNWKIISNMHIQLYS